MYDTRRSTEMSVSLSLNQSYFLGSAQVEYTADFYTSNIYAPGGNSINIQGGVYGLYHGIYSNGKGAGTINTSIYIGASGDVTGRYYAIDFVGVGNFLLNRGEIYGACAAVGTFSNGTFDTFYNYGDVISGGVQIDGVNATIHTNSATSQVQLLVNSGLILNQSASGYAVALDGYSVDTFRNTGEVVGDIRLGSGDDIYNGRLGALDGGIFGQAGNDTIKCGDDDDQLYGGAGNDKLWGGAGEDHFHFDSSVSGTTNVDTIADFTVGDDLLSLTGTLFGLNVGSDLAGQFVSNQTGKAADADDHFIYQFTTGKLYFDVDGKGGVDAVLMATLSKNLKLTADSFEVV